MNKDEMINYMAMYIELACTSIELDLRDRQEIAKILHALGCRKVDEDEIVIKKSEYEKIKSLYDTQKGAIMTSSIGDLPLTIEGLRTAVDEIDRARNAEREAQELCEKYYNEAKDLRRELKRAEQETAKEIFEDIEFYGVRSLNDEIWGDHFKLMDSTLSDLKMKYKAE